MARKTNAQLTAELAKAEQALADLKTNVINTARKYADEHNWCEVVDEALVVMGLNPHSKVRTTYTVEITVEGWYLDDVEKQSPYGLRVLDGEYYLDGDYWADEHTVEVTDVSVKEHKIITPAG